MNRAERRADRRARTRADRRSRAAALGSAAVLAGAASAAVLAVGGPAGANAPIVVDTLADSGAGSLRSAIIQANTDAGADLIQFSVTGTITLAFDLPAITDELVVEGPGSSLLTIDGGWRYTGSGTGTGGAQILKWLFTTGHSGVSGVTLEGGNGFGGAVTTYGTTGTLSVDDVTFTGNAAAYAGAGVNVTYGPVDVTITDSHFVDNHAFYFGGAIHVEDGTLSISNTSFTDNVAYTKGGGAIWTSGDAVTTITGSTFSGNDGEEGGALYLQAGNTTIVDSTFTGNHSTWEGGAIHNVSGDLSISGSTFSGNASLYGGGALYIDSGTVTIADSTLTGNHANTHGGAIMGVPNGMTIISSTITGNTAGVDGDGISLSFSWVSSAPPTPADGELDLISTIVAGNGTHDISRDPTGSETVTSDHSLLGTVDAGIPVTDVGGTRTGVTAAELALGPLADNGGPTPTMLLLPGSVAIDAGPATLPTFTGSDYDQRGPGYPRVANGRVDVGAIEVQPPPPEPEPEPTFTG